MRRRVVANSTCHDIAPRATVQRAPKPCPRPYSEPQESYEEANDALDQIERYVERVLAAGGEIALRRRLAQALGPGNLIAGTMGV